MAKRKYGDSLADDVVLDKYNLDVEAEMNPVLLQQAGDEMATAKALVDKREVALSLIEAETQLKIRRNDPGVYGVAKFTEEIIKALVIVDKDVIEAQEALLMAKDAKYAKDAAYAALKDKSDQIKVLQNLWSGGYFSQKG